MNRVGFGKDIHILKENVPLIIGGVQIHSDLGTISYSDGDALTHAIIDSILGAMGYDDIGEIFPNTKKENKGRSSLNMLENIVNLMEKEGYKILNIDTFINLESPKLGKYKKDIKIKLSNVLHIDLNQISIKAGTNEGIGYIGERKAIECYSICLLEEKDGKN